MMLDPDKEFNALTVRVPALKVKVDSASNVFAVPEPVITLLSALLFIVVCVIPVNAEPSPTNDVDVVTPDITNPLETVGAPFAILFVIRLVRILDILFF